MNGFNAQEHIDYLERPDAAIDAKVDQREAMRRAIDNFFDSYPRRTGNYQHINLMWYLPEMRKRADDFMNIDRLVFDGDALPYEIDPYGFQAVTHDPRGAAAVPENVPIAVYREGMKFHRAYCWGNVTLDSVLGELEKPRVITDLNSPSFGRRLPDIGCQLNILPEGLHKGDMFRATHIWPIDRGDFVIFLRYCSACFGALLEKYEIGRCGITDPCERIG